MKPYSDWMAELGWWKVEYLGHQFEWVNGGIAKLTDTDARAMYTAACRAYEAGKADGDLEAIHNSFEAGQEAGIEAHNNAIATAFRKGEQTGIDALAAKVAWPELVYKKLEPCPVCGANYMYQCTCDSGHEKAVEECQAAVTAAVNALRGGE